MKTQIRLATAATRLARTLSTTYSGRTGIPKGHYTATADGKKPDSVFGLIVKNAGFSLGDGNEGVGDTLRRLVGTSGPELDMVSDAVFDLNFTSATTKNPRRDLPKALRAFAKTIRTANLRKPYTRTGLYATRGTLNIVTPVSKKTIQTLKTQFNAAINPVNVTNVQPTAN